MPAGVGVTAREVRGSGRQRHSDREVVIRPATARLSPAALAAHLREMPRFVDLLRALTVHRIKVRYKQSVLGLAWAVLQPLLLMLIFTVLFALTAPRMPSEGLPYPVFVYAAVLPWTFFSASLSNGTSSFVGHTQLVTKVWFPRELLPLSYVMAAMFDFVVASVLLVGLMLYHGIAPTLHLVWVVPLLALIALLALSLSLALAAMQVRVRDVGLAMPLLLQVWMFLSPVVYPLSHVPARYRELYELNPMAGLIDGFRRVTVLGQAPESGSLLVATLVVLLLGPVCYLYFRAADATLADRV